MAEGDFLVYQSVVPVPGSIISYVVDDVGQWVVSLKLTRPVSAVYRVLFNRIASTDVTFYGRRYLKAVIPDRARDASKTTNIQTFLVNAQTQVIAEKKLRPNSTALSKKDISSLSIGFGLAPHMDTGIDLALQKAIRFLLISDAPLRGAQKGGLLALRKRPLMVETVALRAVTMACEKYNRYARKNRAYSRWQVVQVNPLSVQYTTWDDLEQDLGNFPLAGDLGDRLDGSYDGTARILSISLKHKLVYGEQGVDIASAISF